MHCSPLTCKASHFITADNQVDQAWRTTLKSMLTDTNPLHFLYTKKYLPRVFVSKFSQGSKWGWLSAVLWIVLFGSFWPCECSICFSTVIRERPLPVSLIFKDHKEGPCILLDCSYNFWRDQSHFSPSVNPTKPRKYFEVVGPQPCELFWGLPQGSNLLHFLFNMSIRY